MKVAVVDALARSSGKRYSTHDVVGAGPRAVAGLLSSLGLDVYYTSYEKFMQDIARASKFDAVFISAMITDIGAVGLIARGLRARNYRGPIVLGGPISLGYEKVLAELREVDFVIVGEGEEPISKLLSSGALFEKADHDKLREVPSLAYRTADGKVKYNCCLTHATLEVIHSYIPWTDVRTAYCPPSPFRFYVEVVRGCSNFSRPMIAALGCTRCRACRSPIAVARLSCPASIPPGCAFCNVPAIFGPPRSRSAKHIVREVEQLVEAGVKRLVLSAPDFLDYGRERLVSSGLLTDPCSPHANYDALEELFVELFSLSPIARGKATIMVENVKACLVDEAVARILGRYLGSTAIHIGMETGSDTFNDEWLGKPIRYSHVKRAVRLLREHGMRPYVYAMYNIPGMDRAVYEKTRKALVELVREGVEKITLYKYMELPGTALSMISTKLADVERSEVVKLKRLVRTLNRQTKERLVGKVLRVLIQRGARGIYGYPKSHGPVVVLEGHENLRAGCEALVRVVKAGDRVVYGEVEEILECDDAC
ncbi:MAG: radical SAM protein [Desulfurococcaceae archaeon]